MCANFSVSTRGIHGLTCNTTVTGSNMPLAAVLLDGSNNSIEDVQILGFKNGILVGKNAAAQNDVAPNISGNSGVTNVIHICGSIANPVRLRRTL